MKFNTSAVHFILIFLMGGMKVSHAFDNISNEKTTIYPSLLFPGKVWTSSPTVETTSSSHNIWRNNEVAAPTYRPLETDSPAPRESYSSIKSKECSCPPRAESAYRHSEVDQVDMPRYRSESVTESADTEPRRYRSEDKKTRDQSNESRRSSVPRDYDEPLPFPPRWRFPDEAYGSFPPYNRYWLDEPVFHGEFSRHPSLPLYDWMSPYLLHHNPTSDPDSAVATVPTQVPLRNAPTSLSQSAELTISADWIPAPQAALVDSEEFKPHYADVVVPLRPTSEVATTDAVSR